MILFFDTETTGFYNNKLANDDPLQPYIVQLGAVLDNEKGRTVAQLDVILQLPAGITIPEAASNVHGIYLADTRTCGVSAISAIAIFNNLASRAKMLVAHNLEFDYNLLLTAFARAGGSPTFRPEKFCTMKASTDVLKLPAKWGYKWPKLIEAYKALVDADGFEDAHSALADAMACRAVYYALRARGAT